MPEIKNINNKSEQELENLLKSEREELLKLRSKKEMGHLKKTHKLKKAKKNIARILTALNEE
jgi:large subunit ribosomal protein L29